MTLLDFLERLFTLRLVLGVTKNNNNQKKLEEEPLTCSVKTFNVPSCFSVLRCVVKPFSPFFYGSTTPLNGMVYSSGLINSVTP